VIPKVGKRADERRRVRRVPAGRTVEESVLALLSEEIDDA
jgi:hypothetical protein